jgi:hypothetical protein
MKLFIFIEIANYLKLFEIIGIGFFDCDFLQKFAIGYYYFLIIKI